MRRALAAGLVLTVAAASCGGTTTSKQALHYARESGGADARVTHIERAREPNGEPVDVVLVRANYCGGGGNGVSIPSPNRECGPNYAWFGISPDTRKMIGGSAFLAHGSVRAVADARRSVSVLRTFSAVPNLLAQCKIPRGGDRGGAVAGLCQSEDLGPLGNGDTRVEFLEHWPLSKPRGSRSSGGWIVTISKNGQVLSVHTTGETPPQLQR